MFARAGQPELIRSNQKDLYYLSYLGEGIGQAFRNVKGVHSWIKWKRELDLLADVCYFGLTTICGFQTLGEEYCNIVQVDKTKRAIPKSAARAGLVLLHTVAPYLLNKLLSRINGVVQSPENWPQNLSERFRLWLQDAIPIIQQSILFVHRAHLTLFYLTGVFYHIAKRVTSINYLLVRSGLKDNAPRPTYRLLGYLSAVQLVVTLLFQGYQKFKTPRSSQPAPERLMAESDAPKSPNTPRMPKCSLCLEMLRHTTATPCGHLFCWHCITEWCSSKPQCPLCREPVKLSRLVYLHHFEPT